MSKRKMCPQKINGKCRSLWGRGELLGNTGICPKNTNDNCEIVEPKYKRVKAWAAYSHAYDGWTAIEDTANMSPRKRVPCTILIDRKYMRGKK